MSAPIFRMEKLVYVLLLQYTKYYPAKATNVVMNYTETEAKVREATNDDPWGPSGIDLNKIINQFDLKLEFSFFGRCRSPASTPV